MVCERMHRQGLWEYVQAVAPFLRRELILPGQKILTQHLRSSGLAVDHDDTTNQWDREKWPIEPLMCSIR